MIKSADKNAWLQVRIKELGKTQAKLARLLGGKGGRDRSAVTNIIKGKRKVGRAEVPIIAAYLEMSEAEINARLGGLWTENLTLGASDYIFEMPEHERADRSLGETTHEPFRTSEKYMEFIKEGDVRGGLGGGGEAPVIAATDEWGNQISADNVKTTWGLPADYVRNELKVTSKTATLIEVKGDSMSPTLESGDRVMIDTSDRIPSPGGLFAVWDGLGTVVKRLEFIPNSDPPTLRISSDNPKHREYERTSEEVNVIGRIVWFARRL